MSGPAIVQVSTKGSFSGTTASATLSGVTLNNTLFAVVVHHAGSSTTVSDGTSYTKDVIGNGTGGDAGSFSLELFRLDSASAGSHTATSTGTTGGYGQIILLEASGLITSPFDKQAINNSNSTTATTGSTGTLSNSIELAFAIMGTDAASVAGETNPPTGAGWVSQYNDTSTGNCTLSINTLVTSSNSALSAAWGTFTTGCQWIALIGTYKGVISSPPISGGIFVCP